MHPPPQPPPYVDDDTNSLADSESSVSKSTNTFDAQEHLEDLEDGFYNRRSESSRRPSRGALWETMVVRARRNLTVDDLKNGSGQALLQHSFSATRRARRKRSCYNYCIFGGISGLTILAFLLSVNLSLGIATLMWYSDIDSVLKNWGKSGTGTEGLAWYPTDFLRDVTPIPCHSHNDYWRRVPLFDALRAGCIGVEADVWLFDDDLYVGHNTASLTRNRTFTSLYIDPLVNILEHQNPDTEFYNGSSHGVFDTDPGKPLTLLVDVKTGGEETWLWVVKQLEPLRERGWLTHVENDKVNFRPITVVGTGNTPFDVLTANSTYRDTFFDAPLDQMWESRNRNLDLKDRPVSDFDDSLPGDLSDEDEGSAEEPQATPPVNVGQGMSGVLPTDEFNELNSYYASVSFGQAVGRIWRGRLSPRQMKIIRGQIRGAHRRGLKARYWDLPSWPLGLRNHVWDVLVKEGVDMLNVDDLRAASKQVW
ncbi:Altered inheritance [Hyphodiscus hymeniophilus]|uniref:Altered inheritance of mitochondria protein 6 n=1 Tax=Hyphodiscus hymeniophilus TaxID=353542 RepID=A0A9P7AX54_9HELO|nr:Altered inheritance [Hyphodiscus hymeniophilus]